MKQSSRLCEHMKQSLFAALLLIVLGATAGVAQAQGVNYFGVDATISRDGTVHNTIIFEFADPLSQLEYILPFRAVNLTREATFTADCQLLDTATASTIRCTFIGVTKTRNQLTLGFDTLDQVTPTGDVLQFTGDYRLSLPIADSFVIIRLPEGGAVAETAGAYFPPTAQFSTPNGRDILIYWQRENLTATDPLTFRILYTIPDETIPPEPPVTPLMIGVIVATVVILLVMVGVASYVHKTSQTKKQDMIKAVLNHDENTLIDILVRYNGKVNQRVLVKESDFSKAKVSRLVKSLKERGIIDVEPLGRTNKIILRDVTHNKNAPKEDSKKESSSPST